MTKATKQNDVTKDGLLVLPLRVNPHEAQTTVYCIQVVMYAGYPVAHLEPRSAGLHPCRHIVANIEALPPCLGVALSRHRSFGRTHHLFHQYIRDYIHLTNAQVS